VTPLTNVTRAAKRYRSSRLVLEQTIREARINGASLRAIATATGFTPETIRRIAGEAK
jgi:hypothetical protein